MQFQLNAKYSEMMKTWVHYQWIPKLSCEGEMLLVADVYKQQIDVIQTLLKQNCSMKVALVRTSGINKIHPTS